MFRLQNESDNNPLPGFPLRIGFFEIPKQLSVANPNQLTNSAINRWCWAQFLRTGKAPDAAPQYIHDAGRIMMKINNDPKEARMLTATEKYVADRDAQLAHALKTGHAAGVTEERIRQAMSYLKAGIPLAVVSANSGINETELRRLKSQSN